MSRAPALDGRLGRLAWFDGRLGRLALFLPGFLFIVVLVAIPLGILLVVSFLTDGSYSIEPIPTLANYLGLIDDGVFPIVLWRTVLTAVGVTLACLAIGFPIALVLSRTTPRRRALGTLILMVPLWTNLLVKIYSWKAILGVKGVLNFGLQAAGITSEPVDLFLYNTPAVAIALVSALLPFMVLPILTALERVPPSLLEAATDLGSSPRRVFWTVTAPLARRGVLAGVTFVLVMAIGDIVASEVLGGPSGILVGRVIFGQFGPSDNWPRGAAMGWVLIATMTGMLLVLARIARLGTMERLSITGADPRLEG